MALWGEYICLTRTAKFCRLRYRPLFHMSNGQRSLVAVMALACWSTTTAMAQATATQALTLEVKAVHRLAVSGDPQPLTIQNGSAGNSSLSANDESTRYSLVTNVAHMKIVASIDQALPSGTQLLLSLGSSRGVSLGSVDISNAQTPVDLVTDIDRGSEMDQLIAYRFLADASVGELAPQSRTITLTLTD